MKCSQKELADKLGVGLHLVDSWEQGKFLPMGVHLSKLDVMANKAGARQLAAKFRTIREQAVEQGKHKSRGHNYPAQPHTDHQARVNGRETAFIEVIHLIDEKNTHLRSHPSLLDAMVSRGLSIADIVTHELDMLKANIRALPVVPRTEHRDRRNDHQSKGHHA